jgi:hypothetical protein
VDPVDRAGVEGVVSPVGDQAPADLLRHTPRTHRRDRKAGGHLVSGRGWGQEVLRRTSPPGGTRRIRGGSGRGLWVKGCGVIWVLIRLPGTGRERGWIGLIPGTGGRGVPRGFEERLDLEGQRHDDGGFHLEALNSPLCGLAASDGTENADISLHGRIKMDEKR